MSRAVALAHVFQRSGRAWLVLGMDLKAVSLVERCQQDEVMGLRRMDGAHQRIVSLSIAQRPETRLKWPTVEASAALLSWAETTWAHQ